MANVLKKYFNKILRLLCFGIYAAKADYGIAYHKIWPPIWNNLLQRQDKNAKLQQDDIKYWLEQQSTSEFPVTI